MEAHAAEAAKPVAKIEAAITAARAPVNERAAVEQRIVELQRQRSTLVANKFLNGGDSAELAENTAALQAAEQQLGVLGRAAADALIGIAALEQTRASAAQAHAEAATGIPAARSAVLIAAAERMLEAYGEQICSTFDTFLELVSIAGQINVHARQAGLAQIYPEIPPSFSFPGITISDFQVQNVISANQADMQMARKRLAVRLADLGVAL